LLHHFIPIGLLQGSTSTSTQNHVLSVGSKVESTSITPISAQNNMSSKKYAYITNTNSLNVSVIDTATNDVTTLNVFWADAVSPDGKKLYVENYNMSDNVRNIAVIDAATNMVTAILNVSKIWSYAFTPNGKTLYILDSRPRITR
jgi:YVTN family beta-propeller protein